MPGSYLIDVQRRIVFTRGWGALNDAELIAHAESLSSNGRFDPGFRQIIDFRDLSDIRVTGAGVRAVAQNNPFRRDARRAIVVASDEAFGLTRMFELFTESDPDQFRIFREIGPALEWIGLDRTIAWPTQKPDATFDVP